MDKKEFVNKDTMPNNDDWLVHPLPLLTCEGNGRGGGDYWKLVWGRIYWCLG